MRRTRGVLVTLLGLSWWLEPEWLWAGGGKPATKLVAVADTRSATGVARWIGDIYNSNLWLYGLTVVLVMAAMGLVLGLAFDRLLVLAGLELGKLEHHE